VKRYGSVIGLRPEKIDNYKCLHAAAWPKVIAMIAACNIRNHSIFRMETTISSATSNTSTPTSPPKSADPNTRERKPQTDPCQLPFPDRAKGEWWADMDEVFHAD
jgi:L-rhamnose mutarotase